MSQEERTKLVPREALFVDVGTESKDTAEEKGAYIGMTGVFDVLFEELGDGYVRGKAFDDRAGCFVMAEAFKELKETPYNVVAVGTVQEEVGLRGARTSAWQLEPDYALALEGTFAADVPGSSPHQTSAALRKGSVVTIVDRSIITHPKIMKALMEAAENEDLPYQYKKIPTGGTDAGAIHLTRGGVPAGTLAVPCRYIHGPAAVAHIEDLANTVKLIKAFVEQISHQ
jgi:endoglucanase